MYYHSGVEVEILIMGAMFGSKQIKTNYNTIKTNIPNIL